MQNVYQRRADLVPNLVATVKGAANFESSTYEAVAKARASVGQIPPGVVQNAVNNPQDFAKYAQAQDALGSALSRLLAVVENYPQLKATENFQTLQAQLEGTENRIAFERKKYNDVARAFNTKRNTFPTVTIARTFCSKFTEKPYFQRSRARRRRRSSTSVRETLGARRDRSGHRTSGGRDERSHCRAHRSGCYARCNRTGKARVRTHRLASARSRERRAHLGGATSSQLCRDRRSRAARARRR